MKKLLLLLLMPAFILAQTANGTETKANAFRALSPQTVTTPINLSTMGADGTIGKVTSVMNQNANSGILSGGGLSVNADPTKYDIVAGEGYVSNTLSGTVSKVTWATATAQTTPYLLTAVATYVLKDNTGATVLQTTAPTPQQYRTHIYLGKLAHTTFTTILFAVSEPSRMFNVSGDLHDLVSSFGSINRSGNTISPNGANLQINVSAGETLREGANYLTNRNSPNITTEPAVNATSFRNKFRNGTGGWNAVNTSTVDPNYYDDGTGILALVPNNKFTVKVVYRFGGTGTIHMDYGQVIYDDMDSADRGISAAVSSDPDTRNFASRIGWIIVKQATTSLLDDTKYKFVPADKIGERSAGTSSPTDLQDAYNNSLTPQITTTTDLGAVDIKRGSAADTDKVFRVLNGAGSETFGVTGEGNVTAKSYNVPNTKSTTPIVGGALNARMCTNNGLLYVTEYLNNKIGVFSLENPLSPTKIYDFTVGTAPRHVLVSGRNMFVSCNGADKIEIYDIQNPQSALKIGEILTGSQPKMFELIGSDLYVVCFGTSKVEKYKISMPDSSLSNFSYYKVGDASVGLNPLAISYNGAGLLAVCGNGDNVITILSADDLSLYSSPFGGAGHGTCAWFNKTQLLVTDWTTESLLSIDYSNLLSPVLSSSITVSENPEQIEIIGNKAYIPSLRIGVSPSYLDFIDLSNAKTPVKIKSETLTVNAAGFTAPYTDGVNTYIYVDGHEAPYNIDAIRIEGGNFHRLDYLIEDTKFINRLSSSNLTTNTVDEAKSYSNATNPRTSLNVDNVVRLESGTTTLSNPNSVRDGKIVTYSNVSDIGNVTIINPFLGAPSFTLYPYEAITLQAAKNGSTYKWDAIGGRKNLPSIYDIGVGVGIGTDNPNFQNSTRKVLDINGVSQSMLSLSVGGVSGAYLYNTASSLELNASGAKPIYFSANSGIRATVNPSGVFNIANLSGTGTRTVVADASGNLSASGIIPLKSYTVATLPAGTIGDMAYVTDASGFSYNSILVGGGSGVTIAFFDGTNWRAH